MSWHSIKNICEIFNYQIPLKYRPVLNCASCYFQACSSATFLAHKARIADAIRALVFRSVHGLQAGHERQNSASWSSPVSMGQRPLGVITRHARLHAAVETSPVAFKPRLSQVKPASATYDPYPLRICILAEHALLKGTAHKARCPKVIWAPPE